MENFSIYINLRHFLVVLSFLQFHQNLKAQNYIGFRIGANIHKIENIDKNAKVGWFYLGSEFETEQNYAISSLISLKRTLNKKIDFITGIGHSRYRQKISLKHSHPFFGDLADTLSFALDYLELPVGIQMYRNLTKSKSLGLGIELLTNFQLHQKDNFEKIIYEDIGFLKRNWYSKWLISPKVSIRMKDKYKDSRILEYSIFYSRTISPIVISKAIGFFDQMKNSQLVTFGLEINYFFHL